MTDRTVKVSLTAQVSGYIAGMKQAAAFTSYVGTEAEKLALKRESIRQLGTTLLSIGAVAAAGVGLAVKSFADFDAKMSQVKTLSHATTTEMAGLSDAALTLGQKIGFSATQTADAEIELVKAGLSVADIMSGALKGSLDLAAAGQIDVGKATEIATIALTEFGLKGKDVPHVADLLAAGADKALGGVSDLGEALKSGGLIASQFGLSLDDTVGTLSAFANAGLLGEMAGTTMRQMLLKLGDPSKQAADTMKALGISLYDASGKFVGITNLSGQLQSKLGDVAVQSGKVTEAQRNQALATIFGSRAIQGANVLVEEGAEGMGDWINKVDDAGFAAHQAAGKMDNLSGDISKLTAAFQSDLIRSGSSANDTLRGITQTITGLASGIGNLPGPAMAAGLAVTGVVAAVGLFGGAALLVVPKILAMRVAMQDLNITGKSLAIGIGKGGGVALALTALSVGLAGAVSEAQLTADQIANLNAAISTSNMKSLNTLFTGVDKTSVFASTGIHGFKDALDGLTSSDFFKNRQFDKNVSGFMDAISFGASHLSDDLKRFEAQFRQMGTALADTAKTDFPTANKAFQEYVKAAGGGREATRQLLDAMPDYKAALIDLAATQGKTLTAQELITLAQGKGQVATELLTPTTKSGAKAYADAASQAKDLADQLANLTDQINTANGVGQDAVSANASYQKALADADDTIKKAQDHVKGYSLGIDENTASGAANAAMLSDLAKQNEDAAKKQLALDGNTDNYQKTLAAGRQAVIDRAEALGATADQAQTLADKVAAIPTAVEIKAVMDASQANKALADFNSSLQKFKASNLNVTAYVRAVGGMASGGTVHGVGTAKSDSNLAYLSRGEEVIQEPYASAFRPELKMMNVGVRPHFADGGTFSPASYTPAPTRMYMPGPGPSQGSRVQVNNNINAPQNIDPNELATAIDNRSNWSLRRLL